MHRSGSVGTLGVGVQSAVGVGLNLGVKTGQVKSSIASGVAADGLGEGSTGVVVALWGRTDGLREGLGGLYYGGH